jgi:hypothetical protein
MSYQVMGISEAEVDQLRQELGAVVDRIRGQAEDGKDCGTVEVTAGPSCEDLSVSSEADEKIAGTAKARLDLVFEHPEFGKTRVRVSTRNGSIWFVKAVPEAVIDHVFEVFCRVKGI